VAGFKRDRHVEKLLRAARPEPSAALMRSLAPRRAPRRQFALAGAMTAALLVALSAVGGVSYAANAVNHAVTVAKKVVVPAKAHHAKAPLSVSAGGDQYRPGYGWGDKNHNHVGPPGLEGKGGEKRPPAQSHRTEKTVIVRTSVRLDEQAALYVSVLDKNGKQLLLNQEGSVVGGKVSGPQTKSIHYAVLVPRLIPIVVQIPQHLVKKGQPYRIHVIAVDPQGNKSTTDSLFVG
jgi:hypothetical protein